MNIKVGAAGQDGMRKRRKPSAQRMRGGDRRYRRRHRNRHRQAASAAGIVDADLAVGFVGSRRRLRRDVAMAEDVVVLDRIGGLDGAEARNQARACDRVGGDERNNALVQWTPGEGFAHSPSPTPSITNSVAAKKFPRQR